MKYQVLLGKRSTAHHTTNCALALAFQYKLLLFAQFPPKTKGINLHHHHHHHHRNNNWNDFYFYYSHF